ncbi:MAG: hypothetical protein BYD32DRAFT_434385 [Podila humilis]|nr:MAG: hypothetical protein BYD32DRAFT_434385 [Podila humilis]
MSCYAEQLSSIGDPLIPLYYYPVTPENEKWEEPNLYNFLLAQNKQQANLMYIGSCVMGAQDAAQRGLNDDHIFCAPNWSHPLMTQLTNAEVVAEFYYPLKMIKQVLGITPRCWRPPFGDNREKGNDTVHGDICLEHELSNSMITLAEFWLPTIQSLYQTMPATSCNNISQPYWEENFVDPIQGTVAVSMNGTTMGIKALQITGGTTSGSVSTTTVSGSTGRSGAGNVAASMTSIFGALVAVTIAYAFF